MIIFPKKIEACITFEYSEEDLKDILITALEGGIGYWACLCNDGDEFKDQPKDMPTSEWCWELLKQGKPIEFIDEEEEDENINSVVIYLDNIYDGIRGAIENRVWDGDMDSLDALVADAIIQYAHFGDIVYG